MKYSIPSECNNGFKCYNRTLIRVLKLFLSVGNKIENASDYLPVLSWLLNPLGFLLEGEAQAPSL